MRRFILLLLAPTILLCCELEEPEFQEKPIPFDVIFYDIVNPPPEETGVRIIKNRDQYVNFFGEVPKDINFGEEMIITFASGVRSISIDYRVNSFIEQKDNLFLGFDILDCNECSRNRQSKLKVIKCPRFDKIVYFDFNVIKPRD